MREGMEHFMGVEREILESKGQGQHAPVLLTFKKMKGSEMDVKQKQQFSNESKARFEAGRNE